MSNSLRLVTNRLASASVNNFITEIVGNVNYYYVFAGRSIPYPNGDTAIVQPTNADDYLVIDTYQNMLFGKMVENTDLAYMIPRYEWEANSTVYAMYNNDDPNLYNKNFYTVVNAVSEYYVFKCLYNAGGGPSIIEPAFGDTGAEDSYYQTSDGYFWKYLYTVDKTTFDKFSTINYMPVFPNSNVIANTVDGAIDLIILSTDQFGNPIAGSGYDNYLQGHFSVSDIQVGGNNLLFAVSNSASITNSFYVDCILYINGGTGHGQYKLINEYRVIGNIKEVVINSVFSIVPDATSTYQINPYVQVIGDQNVTINCEGMALINAYNSNGIYQIAILNRGEGYRIATANVLTDASVGIIVNSQLQVIIPPTGGHGFNVIDELGATSLCIGVEFANNEGNTISTQTNFRTIGVLKNPLFSNVVLSLYNTTGNPGTNGNFIIGEPVYQINPIALAGTVAVTEACNYIVGTNTNFTNQFNVNNYVYIISGSNVYFSQVAAVANDTLLTTYNYCLFTSVTANVSLANIISNGVVTATSISTLNLSNVAGIIIENQIIVGSLSYAVANVVSFKINDISKDFITFNQMNKYYGTVQSGTFISGEKVYQYSLSEANAVFNSINSIAFYVSNQVGQFSVGNNIIGSNSGAVFAVSSFIPGDIMVDSGEILYLENDPVIQRSDNEEEYIQIILNF
jgi:hypothetical protein